MIDTITMNFDPVPLHPGLIEDINRPGDTRQRGFFYQPTRTTNFQGILKREALLTRAYGHSKNMPLFLGNNMLEGFSVSLPGYSWGASDRILMNQEAVDQALGQVIRDLNLVATIPRPLSFRVTRLDLCLQFRVPNIPPGAFFSSLRHARHPAIRSPAEDWTRKAHRTGINFKGCAMIIRLYDKFLEMFDSPGDVIRIEVQLRKSALKNRLGDDGEFPTSIDFQRCYEAYRQVLTAFPLVNHLTDATGRCDPTTALKRLAAAYGNAEIPLSDGRLPWDFLEDQNLHPNSERRLRRAITSLQCESHGISFEELLPPTWPPPHLAESLITNCS